MKMLLSRASFFVATLFFLFPSQYVYAGSDADKNQHCDESTLNLVGMFFGVANFSHPKDYMYASKENGGVISAAACKTWPYNQSITIVAVAYEDAEEIDGKSLVVAFIDNAKHNVIASYKGAQIDFANFYVAEDGLRIDTARYDLTPHIRAIGLDVTESYNANCGDGGYGPIRTLFVQDGDKIRPVLENFFLYTWHFVEGGNPRCSAQTEETSTEETTYTLHVGNNVTNGYANLMVTAVSSNAKKKPLHCELHYDGEKYLSTSSCLGF